MLGKLLKYECKATARVFLPLYGTLLIFSVIMRFFHSQSISDLMGQASGWLRTLVQMITILVYAVLITAVFIIALIMIIQRFQKNLLGDEGYLMFTLPAQPWQHICAKLLVATVWTLASCLVAFLSVMILVADGYFLSSFWYELGELIGEIAINMRISPPLVVVEGLAWLLSGVLNGIVSIYAAISLGQLMRRHKVAGAFGAYLALMVVSRVITNLIFRILFGSRVAGFLYDAVFYGGLDLQQNVVFSIVINILFAAAYFLLANWVLSHRLNLE